MRRILWIGICLLSASWLFSIPIFIRSDFFVNIFLIFVGIFCIFISFWKTENIKVDFRYFIFIIPLLFSIFIFPYPFNLGPSFLFLGLIVAILSNYITYNSKISSLSFSLLLSGIILCIQSAFYPLYVMFVSHGHRVDVLSDVVSFFANLFGLKTSVNNGILFVQTSQTMIPFTTTYEKLGFFLWFNILIATLILLFLFYNKRKVVFPLVLFFIISFFYLIFRYVTYIFIYINTFELDFLWNPYLIFFSFLPFALILMKFISFNNCKISFDFLKHLKYDKKRIFTIFLFFIFTICMVSAFTYYDPGRIKDGRILIDEYHSEWEDSVRPIDKTWYGLNSTYNYYSLVKWLNYYYSVDQNIDQELTLDLLLQYDILILKCPTNSYSVEEISSILQFVKNGGGLYLIGDHTDVFGMNTFLNQVSEEFGIRFNMDATYELGTGDMTVYRPNKMYSHPIVHKLDSFDFMTSCTLSAPLNSENIIVGNRLIGEPGTYATENFFRESVESPESEYGLLLQVVAIKSGKGRVVAFSDSTVFSSFSMFSDGYQTFTLGVMEYLNRENVLSYLNIVFFIISIISFFILLYFLRDYNKFNILFLFVVIGFFCSSVVIPLFSSINHINYKVPDDNLDIVNVCFDQKYSNYNISLQPSIGFFEEYDNFGTFYVWTQRINCTPSLEKSLDDAIKKGDVIVFINPIINFELQDIKKINNFLEDGGRILILDSITNTDSTVNSLINNFNMNIIKNSYLPDYQYIVENFSISNKTSPYLSVSGGNKIVYNQTNEIYIHYVNITNDSSDKNGRIVVFVDSFVFGNNFMGNTFTDPNKRQMNLYNLEFFIFEEILLKN